MVVLSVINPVLVTIASALLIIYMVLTLCYSKLFQRFVRDSERLAKVIGRKIKEADWSPLEKEKPKSAFGLAFVFTYLYSMGIYAALYGIFLVFLICFSKDMEFIKQVAGMAVGVMMFTAARFMKVQGDRALHEFRNR